MDLLSFLTKPLQAMASTQLLSKHKPILLVTATRLINGEGWRTTAHSPYTIHRKQVLARLVRITTSNVEIPHQMLVIITSDFIKERNSGEVDQDICL